MKKDTKRWCKGQVGVEHKPVVRLVNYYAPAQPGPANPHPGQQNEALHFVTCERCGKKLRHLDWRDYPIISVQNKR